MKRRRQNNKVKVSSVKTSEPAKEKSTRPSGARSSNLGFHGTDDEKQLNPEE